jgi:hypothetical protein
VCELRYQAAHASATTPRGRVRGRQTSPARGSSMKSLGLVRGEGRRKVSIAKMKNVVKIGFQLVWPDGEE